MTGTLLTRAEIAAAKGVAVETVSRWVKSGLLQPAEAPGRRNRFRAEDARALPSAGRLLGPIEAARIAGVHKKTLAAWQDARKLTPHRTAGGHRRYAEDEVRALVAEGDVMTLADIAAAFGVAEGTVRRWEREKRISSRGRSVAGRKVYLRSDVRALSESAA